MNYKEKSFQFSKIEIDTASKLIERIDPNHIISYSNLYPYKENMEFKEHFSQKSIGYSSFFNCIFNKINFSGTPAKNVIFRDCFLNHCKLTDSNFKYADFTGSKLYLDGVASSFDSSDFSDVIFYNANFKGCSFSESYFYNTQILNTRFIHSEFEGSIFEHVYSENSDLTLTNLDYSEFYHVNFSNVILPYWSILHIVRGFSEIVTTKVAKFATQDGTHNIEQSQYIEEFRLMTPYFSSIGDYLALVNIYLFEGEKEKAYNAMLNGLIESVKHCRFGLMKYLCRMASLAQFFSKSQLREFYQTIEKHLNASSLSYIEYKNYLQELDSAKRLLIDCPFENDSMRITLHTSIPYNDYSKLSFTIKNIDTIINENAPNAISHMEIRHNSPIEITIQISSTTINLITVFAMLEFVFNKATTYIERAQNIIINHRDMKKRDMDNSNIEQLNNQIYELKEKLSQLERKGPYCKTSLILPGTDEYLRISYTLSSTHTIPQEIRTYSTSQPR